MCPRTPTPYSCEVLLEVPPSRLAPPQHLVRARRLTVRFLVLLTGLTVLGFPAACRRASQPEPEPAQSSRPAPEAGLDLSLPVKARFKPEVLATGNLKPKRTAELAMPVPGTLARILVERGQEVKAGAALAVLDAAGARASLAQAEANVQAAQAGSRLAEDAFARTALMHERGALSDAQFMEAKGQRELAVAQAEAALAQRNQARVLLTNHTLTAPFAGVIIRAPNGTGASVGPHVPLFLLEDVRALVLETSLTQEEAAELTLHARVTVSVPATGARVEDATLELIVPSVDPATNRVPIEIAVPNPDRRLLPHAFARAQFPAATERDAYRVPAGALTQQGGAFSLWMADAAGKVAAARVRVLSQPGDGTAVVDPGPAGFPAGARVIGAPPLGITAGMDLPGARGQGP